MTTPPSGGSLLKSNSRSTSASVTARQSFGLAHGSLSAEGGGAAVMVIVLPGPPGVATTVGAAADVDGAGVRGAPVGAGVAGVWTAGVVDRPGPEAACSAAEGVGVKTAVGALFDVAGGSATFDACVGSAGVKI